jgi:hypothetical protein
MPSAGIINGGATSATKSATLFSKIQDHFKGTWKIGTLVNYGMYQCHPESFWAYYQMSEQLRNCIPAAKAVSTHDPACSSGMPNEFVLTSRMYAF